jgi:glycosyltransferase involved in cell wall biosynthesis
MNGKILILSAFYAPGNKGGGSARSVMNLVDALGGEFSFRVVTGDRDLGDADPYQDIVTNRWIQLNKAEVMYLTPGWSGMRVLIKLLLGVESGTVLYLNSFFSLRFSILPILLYRLTLAQPSSVVLAPRGEFSSGALALKPGKKRFYIRVAKLLRLYDGIVWQASTSHEEADIKSLFSGLTELRRQKPVVSEAITKTKRSTIAIAKDIAVIPNTAMKMRSEKAPRNLRVIFVSRISPKKNLLFALELLRMVTGEIHFDIYGPIEDDGYWRQCNDAIAVLPSNVSAMYRGIVEHERVEALFASYDLFLFPTLGENFGHVISEALCAGCPVLISDRTPWRGLSSKHAGWDISLSNPEKFCSILQECIDAESEVYSKLVRGAQEYGIASACDPATIDESRDLFRLAAETTQEGC